MKKLLVIGAGFLQAFVIKRAKELGYYVIAVDGDRRAIGFQFAHESANIDITDLDACLSYAQEKKIDGVLTAATDYGVLTTSYIAGQMHLPGLSFEAAKLVKNKFQVKKKLIENRIDDTNQAFEVDEQTNFLELSKKLAFPVMVKPCDGSGSRGAYRVDVAEELRTACLDAISWSKTKKAEVESFIFGKEYGAESLVVNGEVHVLAIMRKWMTSPPYYAELGHAIPNDLDPQTNKRVKECVANAIKALGINFGSVNMDMLISEEGHIHIVDVGARMGGNMIGPCIIPYGTGVDYISALISLAVGDRVDLSVGPHTAVASRIMAFDDGVVDVLPDFDAISKCYGVEVYHHMEKGQRVNEYHTNLDGCGYIIARCSNVDTAILNATKALEDIKKSVTSKK